MSEFCRGHVCLICAVHGKHLALVNPLVDSLEMSMIEVMNLIEQGWQPQKQQGPSKLVLRTWMWPEVYRRVVCSLILIREAAISLQPQISHILLVFKRQKQDKSCHISQLHVCVHTCGGQRSTLSVLPGEPSTVDFETVSLTDHAGLFFPRAGIISKATRPACIDPKETLGQMAACGAY